MPWLLPNRVVSSSGSSTRLGGRPRLERRVEHPGLGRRRPVDCSAPRPSRRCLRATAWCWPPTSQTSSGSAAFPSSTPKRAPAVTFHLSMTWSIRRWRVSGRAYQDLAGLPSPRPGARLGKSGCDARLAIELDLMLGRHAELVSELAGLTAEHALAESLWGHYMVSLYRCGRQADALAAYRQLKQTLLDEARPGPQRGSASARVRSAGAGSPAGVAPARCARPSGHRARPRETARLGDTGGRRAGRGPDVGSPDRARPGQRHRGRPPAGEQAPRDGRGEPGRIPRGGPALHEWRPPERRPWCAGAASPRPHTIGESPLLFSCGQSG